MTPTGKQSLQVPTEATDGASVGCAAPSGSVLRWTRNTIFKARCVLAEMREAREWVGRIRANPDVSAEDDMACRRTMARIIMQGHWWKLRSLAKELPLALLLDTPGLRTVWRAWKRRENNFSHNTATPEPDDERAHGMAATVLEVTAHKLVTCKCANPTQQRGSGDSRKDGIHSQNAEVSHRTTSHD